MLLRLTMITLILSNFLYSQDNFVTTASGNLTIEMDKGIDQLLKSKEKAICPTSDPVPAPVPEFCHGARIQVFYSKNRTEAESKLKELKSLFPGLYSDLDYISPDYKVKVGYFESRETAQSTLNKARRSFPSALVVEEVIRCKLID
ncbi:SPOR domain-containing protein [Moheibacter lacus]|uniref:SPOR domain-containing protein n=1 Tax=Moheibacter lacus TaxID=2745851 RepID=A0A838ZKD5_9FLAO|nr:SPOR domain-containing protein [Moheibacter lacus]MBA5629708.1 SPOR domain-containing protein [Moheibacter lacus]